MSAVSTHTLVMAHILLKEAVLYFWRGSGAPEASCPAIGLVVLRPRCDRPDVVQAFRPASHGGAEPRTAPGFFNGTITMNRSKAALAVGLGVAVLTQAAVSSQQAGSSAKATALTALDYIEIKQLVSRYAFAVDTGSNNGYDYADLFAADGEFMRPYARGREQLAALARGGRLGPANTVHYIMNHVIEPTPQGAIGRQYLVELNFDIPRNPAAAPQGRGAGPIDQWAQIGRKNGELARTGGHYEDIYVKTDDGWRFKRRDFIPSRSGADPAPLPPPRIPADAAAQPAIVEPAPPARFTPPTRQTTLTA